MIVYIHKQEGNIYTWNEHFDINDRFVLVDDKNRPTKYDNDLHAHLLSHVYNIKAYPQRGSQALRFDNELEY
jgi:hypothetical protein